MDQRGVRSTILFPPLLKISFGITFLPPLEWLGLYENLIPKAAFSQGSDVVDVVSCLKRRILSSYKAMSSLTGNQWCWLFMGLEESRDLRAKDILQPASPCSLPQ